MVITEYLSKIQLQPLAPLHLRAAIERREVYLEPPQRIIDPAQDGDTSSSAFSTIVVPESTNELSRGCSLIVILLALILKTGWEI